MKKKYLTLLLLLPLITGCDVSFNNSSNNGNNNNGGNNQGEVTPPSNDGDNGETTPPDNNQNEDTPPTPPDNGDNNENDPPIEEPSDHLEDVIEEGFPKGDKLFDAFFTYGKKISIELDFTNQSLLKLAEYGETFGNNDNFVKNEMYHPCNMTITMDNKSATYYEVGARMRGNTSRNPNFITSDGHFVNGENFHFKLNFSETFDDKEDNDYYIKPWSNADKRTERKDRKFAKMKKLDFKWNRNYDQTFTKELYCLDAFRSEGVLAQHGNLVEVTIKGEVDSRTTIYQVLESVDKQLIKKVYPDDCEGDLYKCLYQNSPADLTNYNNLGIEKTGFKPTYGLKTNEKTSDMSIIKTFINNVKLKNNQDGYTGEMYYNNMLNYMDVDNFLKYSALCWVFGLPDDLRNNANNYYLYFNKEGKALFLPYDNDRCLGIRKDWDKDLSHQSWDDPYGQGYNEFNKCPLILRFISGGSNNSYTVYEPCKEQYHQYCIEYADKYLDVSSFDEFTKKFNGVAPSIDISSGGIDNDSFATYVNSKIQCI